MVLSGYITQFPECTKNAPRLRNSKAHTSLFKSWLVVGPKEKFVLLSLEDNKLLYTLGSFNPDCQPWSIAAVQCFKWGQLLQSCLQMPRIGLRSSACKCMCCTTKLCPGAYSKGVCGDLGLLHYKWLCQILSFILMAKERIWEEALRSAGGKLRNMPKGICVCPDQCLSQALRDSV